MSIDEILEKIIAICKHYSAHKVFLFGSRAKGTNTKYSDIDIAVSGIDKIEEFKEEIDDIPTLYTIDIIDMDKCRNDLLLEDIYAYGQKIYEKI